MEMGKKYYFYFYDTTNKATKNFTMHELSTVEHGIKKEEIFYNDEVNVIEL